MRFHEGAFIEEHEAVLQKRLQRQYLLKGWFLHQANVQERANKPLPRRQPVAVHSQLVERVMVGLEKGRLLLHRRDFRDVSREMSLLHHFDPILLREMHQHRRLH
jgi:hypothetical protein